MVIQTKTSDSLRTNRSGNHQFNFLSFTYLNYTTRIEITTAKYIVNKTINDIWLHFFSNTCKDAHRIIFKRNTTVVTSLQQLRITSDWDHLLELMLRLKQHSICSHTATKKEKTLSFHCINISDNIYRFYFTSYLLHTNGDNLFV
jgi:hypothetical protein